MHSVNADKFHIATASSGRGKSRMSRQGYKTGFTVVYTFLKLKALVEILIAGVFLTLIAIHNV